MDLKDWEKISSDKKTTKLKHKAGHFMIIAHAALPKIQQQALSRLKMAKGGELDLGMSEQGKDIRHAKKEKMRGEDNTETVAFAKEEAKGRAEEERHVKPKMKGLAKGGEVQHFAEGADSIQGTPPMLRDSASVPEEAPIQSGSGVQQEAEKTLGGVQQGLAGIQGQQAIDAQKAQAMLPANEENIRNEQEIAQFRGQALQDVKNHADDMNQYMQDNAWGMNPTHYQESMDTPKRVSTAIGLFLGGMGQAFGGHNYAQDFLDKQIDRDIAAQRERSGNVKTVFGAYQQLYGDSNIAAQLAAATNKDIYAKKLEQTALMLGTPQAKVNAQMGASKLLADSAKDRLEAAGAIGNKYHQQAVSARQAPTGHGNDDWYKNHVLSPSADQDALNLQFNPVYKNNLPAIQEQKAKADLADKALSTIDKTYPALYENTGGAGGYLRRKGHLLGSIPYAGPIIEAGTNYVTDTNKNAAYESDYSQIVGAVRGALQGNVSDELLDSTVRANAPETNDPPELKKQKQENLKKFVRDHTKTDLLRSAGLSRK